MNRLSRRRWLQVSGATATSLASGWMPAIAAAQSGRSRVAVVADGRAWSGLGWTDADLDRDALRSLIEQTLMELTREPTLTAALGVLFPAILNPERRYGIKVNCVNEDLPTHPAVVSALCEILVDAGARPQNVIVFDRSQTELGRCGFTGNHAHFRVVSAAEAGYADNSSQLSDGEVRLSRILTEGIDDLINMPVLKNHEMAGVTLALKNHFGSIDRPETLHGRANDASLGIAELNAHMAIRDRTRLVLIDGMFGTYRSGLGARPDFAPMTIVAATDPVAADAVGRDLIDQRRTLDGLAAVHAGHIELASQMGLGRSAPSIDRVDRCLHAVEQKPKPWEPRNVGCGCKTSARGPLGCAASGIVLAAASAMLARSTRHVGRSGDTPPNEGA